MPRYFGYRRWYGRRGYGRRYRRWWSRRGFARSMNYIQKSGTKRYSVIIPVEEDIDLPCIQGYGVSAVFGVSPFYTNDLAVNAHAYRFKYGSLVRSPVFNLYTQLYDEVKVNGFSIKFGVAGMGTAAAPCHSATLYTSIDRHCVMEDVNRIYGINDIKSGVEHAQWTFTSLERALYGRSFNARDLMEKSVFVDSTLKTVPVAAANPVPAYNITTVGDWYDYGRGGFVPLLVGCFQRNDGETFPANSVCHMKMTVRWNVTFRNPKYQVIANARGLEEGVSRAVDVEGAGKSVSSVGELEDAFKKLQVSGVLGDDDDVVLKDWKERRLAKRKARLEKLRKLRALERELEKDDDTLIDPDEEVLPDDDLLMDDDDDAPTQPIKELENKSSS